MATRIHRITSLRLYFIPVQTRVPLKFGNETLTSVTCARVAMGLADETGRQAEGWGETPLSVQWVWPATISYALRHQALLAFCRQLASAWMGFRPTVHPIEAGWTFHEQMLPAVRAAFNRASISKSLSAQARSGSVEAKEPLAETLPEPLPHLAGLVCNSAFDLALHDAYARLAGLPVYETYGRDFLEEDLSRYLEPARDAAVSFRGRYPSDYLLLNPARQLRAWHLVGGLDFLEPDDVTGEQPNDGYPIALTDWIDRDGLKCLKVKLRGNNAEWDYDRLVRVGRIALAKAVDWLSADFNCTVQDPAYVNEILDRLRDEHPRLYGMLLYVEQPFPYDLERARIHVHSVSARKPLFLDESAHDWRLIRLGRELGWSGVALKTCKTQTGAILAGCWAKAHGLNLMVQDLTNPMLAQIPHVLLAAHVGTIMGVETNSMQFYPAASEPEARVHPGLYQRREGGVDWSTVRGPGFGYRLDEIQRTLPEPAVAVAL